MRKSGILILFILASLLHAEVKLDGTFDWNSSKVKKLCKSPCNTEKSVIY